MRRGRLGPSHTSSYPASFCRLPPSSLCLRTPPSLLLTSTPILPLSFILILLHFTLGWACFLQCTPIFLQMISLCISLCLYVFLHLLSYLGSLIPPPPFLYLLSPHFPLTLETMSWTSVLTPAISVFGLFPIPGNPSLLNSLHKTLLPFSSCLRLGLPGSDPLPSTVIHITHAFHQPYLLCQMPGYGQSLRWLAVQSLN